MKKILTLFCTLLGITPSAFAGPTLSKEIPDSSVSDIGYFHKGNCITERDFKPSSDDWLVVSERGALQNFTVAYKVDGGKCSDIGGTKDTICVAGYAQHEQLTRKNSCFFADRAWAGSWLPGNDTWKLDSQAPLLDCPTNGNTWTKEGPDKIAVFVKQDDSIITTKSGKPVRSLNTRSIASSYNVKCIAYVCVDTQNNNRISYGNPDGTCSKSSSASDFQDDSSSGKHRNSVQQYLNALNCPAQ